VNVVPLREGWKDVAPPPPKDWAPCDCVTVMICGRTSHLDDTEARFAALREGQETPGLYTGCGVGGAVLSLYRCLQCGRWMHASCLRIHFETSGEAYAA
jgi:hypothetical protein